MIQPHGNVPLFPNLDPVIPTTTTCGLAHTGGFSEHCTVFLSLVDVFSSLSLIRQRSNLLTSITYVLPPASSQTNRMESVPEFPEETSPPIKLCSDWTKGPSCKSSGTCRSEQEQALVILQRFHYAAPRTRY